MANKYLDNTGLSYLWSKIRGLIPTKTSQLANDSGYLTSVPDGSITKAKLSTELQTAVDDVSDLKSSLEQYEDIFTGDVDTSVKNWLNEHPEATTTVQDGSITKAKLSTELQTAVDDFDDLKSSLNGGLTVTPGYMLVATDSGNGFEWQEVELGVADNSVTEAKIADHAVTLEKTDFYYDVDIHFSPSWLSHTAGTSKCSITKSNGAIAYEEFPDILSLVTPYASATYPNMNNSYRINYTYQKWYTKYVNIEVTQKAINANGQKYHVATITREAFRSAYETALAADQSEGFSNAAFAFNGNGVTGKGDTFAVLGEVDADIAERGFTKTYISPDFVTAVNAALDSDSGDLSRDEELARIRLSGKVMIALGDSYTSQMSGLLSSLATKYEMVIDNRGVVSSSICGDLAGNKGYKPMWNRADTIVSDYSNGYTIDEVSYSQNDVGIIVFMGGANDGFGIETWVGTGIHDTDTNRIYGACNHIFNVLQENFPNAKLICITQPSSYNRVVSTAVPDDATAQVFGFENRAAALKMSDVQFSNYAMALKETAVKETAWVYGLPIIDMFNDFPSMFNPSNRTAYWNSDKLHLTNAGYALISKALDKKIVEITVA